MSDIAFADRYRRMLVDVGGHASEFGDRPIASHWPFVGSQFSGTLIVGKALAGWDAHSYHPGAHIKGLTRDDFAAQIAGEMRAIEDG